MAAFLTNFGNSIFEATTEQHQNSLEAFLNKFSQSDKLVDQIDTQLTFDIYITFQPSITQNIANNMTKSQNGPFNFDLGNETANKYATNFLNNASGGLYNSVFNKQEQSELSIGTFKKEKENAKKASKDSGLYSSSFLEYLSKASMLVGKENFGGKDPQQLVTPLYIQLGYYVQSITIPKIKIDSETSNTYLGNFLIQTGVVSPDNNTLQLDVLCTKLQLHENIFYPWMREVTMPFWTYDTQPYTTATITVDFSKHTDLQYVFTGCRPTQIETLQPTQEVNTSLTRQVVLTFDYMFIQSKERSATVKKDKNIDKLIATGKTLFNTVNKFI